MKLYLIRHGTTEGNKRKAYIGARTDEPLCAKGMAQLQTKHYPKADIVFASPMKRCIMTAEAIYPNQEMILCEGFKEMDFGDFEGKSYEELKDNPDYINWIESGGEIAFPNGERKKDFACRCQNAFRACIQHVRQSSQEMETAAFVVHGGTIMAIMEEYGTPKGDYYGWRVQNGEFIELYIKLGKNEKNSDNTLKNRTIETDIICVRKTHNRPAPK